MIEVPAGTYTVSWPNPSGSISQIIVQVEANKKTVIRGSILRFPQGNGEVYLLKDQSGLPIWNGPIEFGDYVWVLPGVYRLELDKVTGNAAIISLDVQTLPVYVWERCRGMPFDVATDLATILPVARGMTLLFWWVLLVYAMRLGMEFGGTWGGRLALLFVGLDPNLLGHAGLATTDIAVVAGMLGFIYYVYRGRDRG